MSTEADVRKSVPEFEWSLLLSFPFVVRNHSAAAKCCSTVSGKMRRGYRRPSGLGLWDPRYAADRMFKFCKCRL